MSIREKKSIKILLCRYTSSMLSIILYGRNDQHGYNYHKRFAISLNCLAEMLLFPEDEILFVDYNSADDEPTIVEVLQDTLSEKAKNYLKIFRVRAKQHQLVKTGLAVCEPIARNVAIRRSNPKNRWILSTNIDMIFVPFLPDQTLSEIVAELPDGFYQLPRFELPENLWESKLHRLKPKDNIAFLQEKAQALHLQTIVRRDDFRMYDNPGDFQLMLRKDIFHIGGFDEKMVLGWHLDSNLCKRMFLLDKQKIYSLEDRLAGYHCNHTRTSSLVHSKQRAENSWKLYVQKINSPFLSGDWGLAKEEIEEIKLQSEHAVAFENLLMNIEKKRYELPIDFSTYNTLVYPMGQVVAHLMDHFCHLSSKSNIAYIGHNEPLVALLENYLSKRKWEGKILRDLNSDAALLIFDFGFNQEVKHGRAHLRSIMTSFLKAVRQEKKSKKNRKFIGINVMHTDFRALFHRHLSLLSCSYATGVVYGYVGQKKKINWKITQGLKRKFLFAFHYFCLRYFYKRCDKIRHWAHERKLLR